MGRKWHDTGMPSIDHEYGAIDSAGAQTDSEPSGVLTAVAVIAPTAELPAERMAAQARHARAVRSESWRPPEKLDEYELRAPIGRGGMGWVCLYWDTLLERDVAIKFVRTLDEEGKAAARFHHPNVATVYRVGETGGGWRYIAAEYIEGENLAELVPVASRRRVLQIARDLACGLAAAHEEGVVHGDIKPANAMIDRVTGTAKLIDFGLARRIQPLDLGRERREPNSGRAANHVEAPLEETPSSRVLVGTMSYLAPELWQGVPISARSDIYAFGVLLYEICAGRPPRMHGHMIETPLALDHLEGLCGKGLTDIIARCLKQQPNERYAMAGEVLAALDDLERSDARWAGNPYRGLLPFEREHKGVFFGRDSDIWRIVELMREQRFLILVGGSGIGKSSLARAGVLTSIAELGVADGRQLEICTMMPGERPLLTFSRALAALLRDGREDDCELENVLRQELEHDLVAVRRRLRQRNGRASGTVLFIDQLEELVTLSEPHEAQLLARAIGNLLAERTPGVRVLATARSDHLAALSGLPELGPLVHRAAYLVGPLGPHAMREAIIRPALSAGLRFEPTDLVDELVGAVSQAQGGLPVLQFALAKLWEGRVGQVISREVLTAIGGVEGALALHADQVLDVLPPAMRMAARCLLLELVTQQGTRARRRQAEITGDDPLRREALEALIRGRLLVTGDIDGEPVCEIAHEALVSAWPRLAAWLEEDSDTRAIRQRLSRAANDWNDAGRARDALWAGRFLRDAQELDSAHLGSIERAFLFASRRALTRARWLKVLTFGGPIAIVAIVAMALFVRAQTLELRVGGLVTVAERALETAHAAHDVFRARRAEVAAVLQAAEGAAITQEQRAVAETAWRHALASEPIAARELETARGLLEEAFKLDRRSAVRTRLAALLDAQAVFAYERNLYDEQKEILAQLRLYDGDRHDEWSRPLSIRVESDPPAAHVVILDAKTGRIISAGNRTPFDTGLEPGAYVLLFESDREHHEVKYAINVPPRPILRHQRRDPERLDAIRVKRPASTAMPAMRGYVYVPEGPFMFGYGANNASEGIRSFYETVPVHERRTAAFWIAPNETTYAEWIEFLEACANGACLGLEPALPHTKPNNVGASIALVKQGDGGWALTVRATSEHHYTARVGEKLVYTARVQAGQEQRWLELPVTGISARDVHEYLAWLDRSGRLPGARLCREDEWERAARGADTRSFPHGDVLLVNQANVDLTYGRVPGSQGADEVGSHVESNSPFGLRDMAGNAWEMTRSLFVEEHADDGYLGWIRLRGGSNIQPAFVSSLANRWIIGPDHREADIGFRICVDAD